MTEHANRGSALWLLLAALALGLPSASAFSGDGGLSDRAGYQRNLKLWLELSEEKRVEVRSYASRMSSGRIRELKRRYEQFKALPEAEQERIRMNYQEFCTLDGKSKDALRHRYVIFKNLSQEKRQAILTLLSTHRNRDGGNGNSSTNLPASK